VLRVRLTVASHEHTLERKRLPLPALLAAQARLERFASAMPGSTKYIDANEILKFFQAEVATLKVDDDLASAGVDSFAVMRLCDDIGNEIGLEVNPTSVFQWGNCAKFATGLKELIADPTAKPAKPKEDEPAAPAAVASSPPAKGETANAWVGGKPAGTGTTGLPIIEINGKKFNLPEGQSELPPFVIEAPEDSVENLMEHLGMKDYAAPMIEEGYDDVKIIQILEEDEFGELCNDIAKMKKGHFRKFKMVSTACCHGSHSIPIPACFFPSRLFACTAEQWKDATNMKVAGTWEEYGDTF
jgi:acyl carrier protein